MIQLRGICKSFQRPGEARLEVLKEVELEVEAGELVAVVGPSGSGKTTLMNILGLLDRPDSGSYVLHGDTVYGPLIPPRSPLMTRGDAPARSGLSSNQLARLRNRKIGFVFQQFHLLARTTALENVELPLVYSETASPEARAAEALCQVGLEDRLTHYPSELSGGQQQRVAIARALVNEPDLILADEPTGNLDRASGEGIMKLFQELNAGGRTIVLITHNQELARQASRVVRIEDGHLRNGGK